MNLPAAFLERYGDAIGTVGRRTVAHRMLRVLTDDFQTAPTDKQLALVGESLSSPLSDELQTLLDVGDSSAS